MTAALELFIEGGAKALTVDAVSEKSGVAKTTIYRHWENRAALAIDTVTACIPAVELPDESLPFEEALKVAVRSLAAGLGDERLRAAIPHLLSVGTEFPEMAPVAHDIVKRQYSALITVLERGVADGSLPADTDILEAKHQLFGPIFVTALSMDEPLGDAEADRTVELFLCSRC
jgi:AcrR family transcriptional regulator